MIRVYVITHKDVSCQFDDLYIPLVVGANHNNVNYANKDNTGVNISDKNGDYCELTGQYWIWKNTNDDIVGLNHYRRYFYIHGKRINESQIASILAQRDIIVADKYFLEKPIKQIYEKSELNHYLLECIDILKTRYPDYCETFNTVILNRFTYPYNMFICKKEICDAYSEWLFDVLFALENRIESKGLKRIPRAYGYLSENLLMTWVATQKLTFYCLPVFNTEESILKQKIKYRLNKIFNRKVL